MNSEPLKKSEQTKKHDHAGHRKRMKEKFLNFGPKIFEDHELLEMLLFYSIPQKNTNDIAHELINKFGTPRNVIEADPKMLVQTNNVKDNTVMLFSLISEIYRRDVVTLPTEIKRYDSLSSVGEFFSQYYNGLNEERFCALLLDGSMRLIEFLEIESSSKNSVTIDPAAFARSAVFANASNVIIAHNHPAGASLPSNADRELTSILETTLSAVKISLVEHIIVGEVGYTPTMQIRLSSPRSPFSSNRIDNDFLRKFYSN